MRECVGECACANVDLGVGVHVCVCVCVCCRSNFLNKKQKRSRTSFIRNKIEMH